MDTSIASSGHKNHDRSTGKHSDIPIRYYSTYLLMPLRRSASPPPCLSSALFVPDALPHPTLLRLTALSDHYPRSFLLMLRLPLTVCYPALPSPLDRPVCLLPE